MTHIPISQFGLQGPIHGFVKGPQLVSGLYEIGVEGKFSATPPHTFFFRTFFYSCSEALPIEAPPEGGPFLDLYRFQVLVVLVKISKCWNSFWYRVLIRYEVGFIGGAVNFCLQKSRMPMAGSVYFLFFVPLCPLRISNRIALKSKVILTHI